MTYKQIYFYFIVTKCQLSFNHIIDLVISNSVHQWKPIFLHTLKSLFTKIKFVKMTKQHIFIIENNLQKVRQSFFYLSCRTTMVQDLLVQRQYTLVQDNQTNANVEACKYLSCLYE